MSTKQATRLDEIRAVPDPAERARLAAEMLAELEATAGEVRAVRDDAMCLILMPPYGVGTMKLGTAAKLIGVTRGLMSQYYDPVKVARRRQRSAAARAAG